MADSLIRPIAVNVNTGALTYTGSLTTSEITDGTIAAVDLAAPLLGGYLASGNYYYTVSQAAASTSSTLGVGSLRLSPWFVPNTCTLSRIGATVTSAGDSGSKVRLGIYADSGTGYPGNLVIDAGTIAGDSNTTQEITISQALTAGLYWIGGAVQVVSVTQPTVTSTNGSPPMLGDLTVGTTIPASGTAFSGYIQTSVTGALPSPFTSTVTTSSASVRVFVKVA